MPVKLSWLQKSRLTRWGTIGEWFLAGFTRVAGSVGPADMRSEVYLSRLISVYILQLFVNNINIHYVQASLTSHQHFARHFI